MGAEIRRQKRSLPGLVPVRLLKKVSKILEERVNDQLNEEQGKKLRKRVLLGNIQKQSSIALKKEGKKK